ncbi:hypothetical protein GALMADRAFT_139530 [Galerina marginata CBS 339.88]|uniref:Uncharacterized protein n=1 Tax=Galerina marginata (strain CBS 339.88) TaxID=685588 RepID=A0A067T2R2_GALM3|nr:hypothetical protein GALMADRAFT_139530 [Galerina marginata CBS 339.88]
MSFPTKSHLPLITTRVEFTFNTLPPPPQITTRRDFGAHIKRGGRHNSVPYSRPKPREGTPARARSVGFNLQSDSSLSELSDTESESDDDKVPSTSGLIPKPSGEAGKANSGGYNLQEALGWTKKRYDEFYNHIKSEVAEKLDIEKCFSRQKREDLEKIIQSTAQKFEIENIYSNNWPMREALKARLKYTADLAKKQGNRRVQTELKQVLRPDKGKSKAEADD